ncbi:MAG: ArsR family transcriptional regulator [Anaerolineales bacterium]|nr:ArsR family transcriptional regulator [Anaerolineales bacterium]
MLNWFYPPYLRQLFTDRHAELGFLQMVADDLANGRPHHVAVFGLRRIGKTLLLFEQLTRLLTDEMVLPVYINLEDICTSPEVFSQRYMGLVAFWALTSGEGEIDRFLTIPRLLAGEAASSKAVVQTAGSMAGELDRSQPDYGLLLKLAFDFPQRLASELGKKLVLFLDEFTEISVLSNYPRLKDPLKSFRASVQQHGDVAHVIAGSAISVLERMIKAHQSPLFLQFEMLELAPFSREGSLELASKILPGLSPLAGRQIHRLSFGHPFYITAIAQRARRLPTETLDTEAVTQAFVIEALSREGQIYNYCRYLYDISLQRARGYGILKAILQVLAEEEELTLSEIARRIAKSPPATREYLRWLMEVDLVTEEDKLYFYRDPVLRYWVAYATKGIEVDHMPRRQELHRLMRELEEKFQSLSTELGLAKESQVREILRHFAGQEVDGILLGVPGAVQLPTFRRVDPCRSDDGQVEVDALADGDVRWAVEIKWRGKMAGLKEVKKLARAAQALSARPWFISKAGFTSEVQDYARQEGIMCSSREEIEALARIVGELP